MKRVAITGSSGYLGSRLARFLREGGAEVLGIDIRPPHHLTPDEFAELDICDPALEGVLRRFKPDTVIHGAFAVEPMRDLDEMRRINIEGSQNLLRAAEGVAPERLMLISSATVYGAWPDNPVPMNESRPLRAREGFPYAAHKVEVEAMFDRFAERFPACAVSRVRPAIIGRKDRGNYLHRFIFGMRFLAKLDGFDQVLQLVDGYDVIRAIGEILRRGESGPFNAAPADSVRVSEIARRTERWNLPLPLWFVRFVYQIGWTLRLPWPKAPPGFLYFARFPWVVKSKRLEEEFGFAFRYSSAEVLEEILKGE